MRNSGWAFGKEWGSVFEWVWWHCDEANQQIETNTLFPSPDARSATGKRSSLSLPLQVVNCIIPKFCTSPKNSVCHNGVRPNSIWNGRSAKFFSRAFRVSCGGRRWKIFCFGFWSPLPSAWQLVPGFITRTGEPIGNNRHLIRTRRYLWGKTYWFISYRNLCKSILNNWRGEASE